MLEPYYDADGVTIYHGDALDVLPELSGIGAVITDPPYSSGGAFRGDRARRTSAKYHDQTASDEAAAHLPDFTGDSRDQRGHLVWSTLWMTAAFHASLPAAPIAVFTDWRQLPLTTDAIQAAGWTWRGIAQWDKRNARPQHGAATFVAQCEYVPWGTRGPRDMDGPTRALPGVFGARPIRGSERLHQAQKPDEVMRWLVGIAAAGAVVLDPFCGSGSTLRAAQDVGLRAVGIDADERSCAIAAERLAQRPLVAVAGGS